MQIKKNLYRVYRLLHAYDFLNFFCVFYSTQYSTIVVYTIDFTIDSGGYVSVLAGGV